MTARAAINATVASEIDACNRDPAGRAGQEPGEGAGQLALSVALDAGDAHDLA